ncbi:MAG: GAF domain-containing protein [Anaerolineae bacterium]|nr:GAF domain-containing protein [Anaerolineae bacterium]
MLPIIGGNGPRDESEIEFKLVHTSSAARLKLYLGGLLAAIALIVLIISYSVTAVTLLGLLAWTVCLLLASILLIESELERRVAWYGLASSLMMVILLSLGAAPGLALGLFSTTSAGVFQRFRRSQSAQITTNDIIKLLCEHWLMMLPGLLVALFVLQMLGVSLPVSTLNVNNGLGIVLALLAGFIARQIIWYWQRRAPAPKELVRIYPFNAIMIDSVLQVFLPLAALAFDRDYGWLLACGIVVTALYILRSSQDAATQRQLREEISALKYFQQGTQNIQDASRRTLESLEREQALEIALETASNLVAASGAAVFLIAYDHNIFKLEQASGSAAQFAAQWSSVPSSVDFTYESMRIVHKSAGDAPSDLPEFAQDSPYQMIVETPLRLSNRTLGILRLYFEHERVLTDVERSLVEQLTSNTAQFYETLGWFSVMENYAVEMVQLTHLAQISSSNLSLDTVLEDMIRVLRQLVNMNKVTLALAHAQSSGPQALDLYGDVANSGVLMLDSVPEFAIMRQPEHQRPRYFEESDADLSAPLRELIAAYGHSLAVFPLLSHYDLLGLIMMSDARGARFADHQWQVLEMASNQIASHILNARLFVLTQAALNLRMEQLSILSTIAQQISSALDPDSILATMLEMAVRSTEANTGTVSLLLESDDVWKILQYQEDGTLNRIQRAQTRDEGVIGQVLRTKETVTIPDTRQVASYLSSSSTNIYLSAVAIPLVSETKVIGVLHMESLRPDFFTREKVSFLTNLARHAVISIENARLLSERQRQIQVLRELQSLSIKLSSATETKVVAEQVLVTSLELLDGRAAILFRVIEEEGKRHLEVLAEDVREKQDEQINVAFKTTSHALRAAQSGEMQIVPDLRTIGSGSQKAFSAIFVPIMRGERTREILCIGLRTKRTLGKRELDTVALLASQAGGHLENATLHEYIHAGNDRMRAILNSTRDGVILLDKSGRLVEVNPSAQRLLGIDLDDHIGQGLVDILLQYASTDEFQNAGYNREEVTVLARQLRLEPERISRRQFSRTSPKQTIYIEEIGSPVVDSEGQISGRLLVLRDVTEQKQLADYRDEITHMAVHDLRGPLASIISSLSFTLEDPTFISDEDALRKTLGLSLESANNLMRLVESLLDIARLEKRQMPLHFMPTTVDILVAETIITLTSSIQNANVTVERDITPDIPSLTVDHDIIRRVLVNLVDNALRFTPADSKILIQARDFPEYVMIRVADSGPGIPPEERERIFERFRQVKANQPLRGARGVGLGLTFCKLAVENHGGRIWVENDSPLSGACFALTLPRKPANH